MLAVNIQSFDINFTNLALSIGSLRSGAMRTLTCNLNYVLEYLLMLGFANTRNESLHIRHEFYQILGFPPLCINTTALSIIF